MSTARPTRIAVLLSFALCALAGGTASSAGDVRFLPGDAGTGPAVGTQLTPSIAAGADGFLAAWREYRSSPVLGPPSSPLGRGVDIYARRLDANGTPLSAPIALATGFGDQIAPQVAWNGENWLVAWETPCECWSYSSQILAVRVSPEGLVLDDTPITVHTNTDEWFRMTANGSEWMVVPGSLRGVRISADGELQNPGGTQLVVRETTGRHHILSAQGEYLLLWDSWGSAQGQRFSIDLTPIGDPFPVPSTYAASSGQDYFVIWDDQSTYWDDYVLGRQFSGDGVAGPVLTLAGDGEAIPLWYPGQMAVGWDGSNWWATWLETTRGTVFSRVTPGGAVLDFGGTAVDPAAADHPMYAPAVAGRPSGGAQFVWQDKRAEGGIFDILSVAVDTTGTPATPLAVSTSARAQRHVDFATGETELLTVFSSDLSGDHTVVAQRLNASGNAIDPEPFVIASGTDRDTMPGVGFDGTRYMVAWETGGQVYARRVDPSGAILDPLPLPIMTGRFADVAGLDGKFVVVTTQETTGEHVWQPFRMRVDGSSGALLDASPLVIGGSFAVFPRVIAFGGRWLATWQENFTHDNPASEAKAAFIEADGSSPGQFVVNSYGGNPDVAANDATALFAVRTGVPGYGNDIVGRFLSVDGTLAPSSFTISADPEDESIPAVGWSGTEFVVAWEDRRNKIIYFDERQQVYAARVQVDGSVVDPAGFSFGDRSELERNPAVASFGGRTWIAASSFRDESALGIDRIAYEVLDDVATGNRSPVAVASATTGRGDLPLAVGFDSAGSFDPDGTLAAYLWDFGDGFQSSSPNPSHTYAAAGNYLAELTVTDDQGTSTTNVVRVVVDTVNLTPIAVPAADVIFGDPPLSVVFNARDSYDPDTGIQNWEWDFGDGWDYWGVVAYHTFTTPGIYTVTHMAHDFRGATGTGTMTIQVGQPNFDPVAVASATLLGGPTPLPVTFDGSSSWDPDGTVASYAWSFGDGGSAIGPSPSHVYTAPGSFAATLTVTDNWGATASVQVAIDVIQGEADGWTTSDYSSTPGAVVVGSHMDTHDQNDVCEELTETTTIGSPSVRRSLLEHVWTMDVAPGAYQRLAVDAHHSPNAEGDDFVLEYSTDQLAWTAMLTITDVADADVLKEYWFPHDVTGTLYVRVKDTDRTPGNYELDTVFVDEMYVLSTPSVGWVGTVPDSAWAAGSALLVGKNGDGTLSLDWGDSCMASDTDFAVYEGPLGAFSDHLPVVCSTGGLSNATVTPSGGSYYYLVVARDDAYEGSYGADGSGTERSSGFVQCLPMAAELGCP